MSKSKIIKNLQDLKDKKSVQDTMLTDQTKKSELNQNSIIDENLEPQDINASSQLNNSEDTENKSNVTTNNDELNELQLQLDSAKIESQIWQQKAFRYVADLDNSRKQQELELAQTKKNTKKYLCKPLLDFLNNQYLAIGFIKESNDEKIQKSISTISVSFEKLLADFALQGIDIIVPVVGDDFNPEFMQSLNSLEESNQINKSDDEMVKIKYVVSLGLKADGQLISPSMVMI